MKSIIQKSRGCYFCGTTKNLEEHHIFFGNPGRKISEKNGFKVYLCDQCHRIRESSPHRNRKNDLMLKELCQKKKKKTHTREEFMELVGRNYL